jgi:hypothetical protein
VDQVPKRSVQGAPTNAADPKAEAEFWLQAIPPAIAAQLTRLTGIVFSTSAQ